MIIVESPLQLMCAIEYQNSKSAHGEIFVRLCGNVKNDRQLLEVISFFGCGVSIFKANSSSYLLGRGSIALLMSLFRVWFGSEPLVIGSLTSRLLSRLTALFSKERIVYLDDGIATILEEMNFPGRYKRFSFFELESELVESHRFEYIQSFFCRSGLTVERDIFIGQKLVEAGIMTEADYIRCVEYAAGESKQLLYLSHRGESERTLDAISEIPALEIVVPDIPSEVFLHREGIKPKRLFFHSSTLSLTLPMMVNDIDLVSLRTSREITNEFPHYEEYLKCLRSKFSLTEVEV